MAFHLSQEVAVAFHPRLEAPVVAASREGQVAFRAVVVASLVLYHSCHFHPQGNLSIPTISAQGLMVASGFSRIIIIR